jgi:hypothetical protein
MIAPAAAACKSQYGFSFSRMRWFAASPDLKRHEVRLNPVAL